MAGKLSVVVSIHPSAGPLAKSFVLTSKEGCGVDVLDFRDAGLDQPCRTIHTSFRSSTDAGSTFQRIKSWPVPVHQPLLCTSNPPLFVRTETLTNVIVAKKRGR